MRRRTRWLCGFLAIIFLTVALGVFLAWYNARPPEWVQQIRPGMTVDEVIQWENDHPPREGMGCWLSPEHLTLVRDDGWVARIRFQNRTVASVEAEAPGFSFVAFFRSLLHL